MPRKIIVDEKTVALAMNFIEKKHKGLTYTDISRESGYPKDFIYSLLKACKSNLKITGFRMVFVAFLYSVGKRSYELAIVRNE